MADVLWIGVAASVPQVDTITVGSATAAQTFAVTVNGKTVTYTAGTGETTATVAAALQALLAASTEGEFAERTWAVASSTVTSTGPADGAPITTTVGGTGTISVSTTTSPVSPHDMANGANYSTGALPDDGDRLVLQDTDVGLLYNLDAIGSPQVDLLRRATFTGAVGLPDVNAAGGYREYRRTHLRLNTISLTVEQGDRDGAGQVRLETINPSGTTVTVTGGGPTTRVGSEVVEVIGLATGSVVDVAGASVAVAPKLGQTATVGTLLASNATVRVGPGATLSAGPTLTNVQAQVDASWSGTLTLDGGQVVVGGSAAGAVAVDGGTVVWRSTGNPGASPAVGGGGTLDLTQAPAALTISGTVQLYAGATLDDRVGRGGNYAVKYNRCTPQEANWLLPSNKTLTAS